MNKLISVLLLSVSSWGLKADMIEHDYSIEARLFAPYLNLNMPSLINGTADNSNGQQAVADATSALDNNKSAVMVAANLVPSQSISYNLNRDTNHELALINQLLGADTALVKAHYLDFKNSFTEFVGLAGQSGINQNLVFDPMLVSKPKEDFRWDRARVEIQSEGGLGWPIHWLQATYKFIVVPTNLVIILLVLSVIVLIKRRFFN